MASLIQLQYIIAVDKYRHFAKAAKACHVSQPTLSQQIQKLEDDLGVILFDRLQKPILPTPEGKNLIEQARTVVREHQKFLHLSKQSGEVGGEFRLGVIPTVASQLLPLFLADFSKRYPKIELFVEELKTQSILDELKADRLDGAVCATPTEEAGLKEHPLYYEPFYVYLSESHPLLKKESILPTEIDKDEIWLLQDGHCFKTQVAQFCRVDGHHDSVLGNVHFQSGSLNTLLELVKRSRGLTLIPALMLDQLPAAEVSRLVRPFRPPLPVREISFVYRRDHWKLDFIKAIEENIKKNILPSLQKRNFSANVKSKILGI